MKYNVFFVSRFDTMASLIRVSFGVYRCFMSDIIFYDKIFNFFFFKFHIIECTTKLGLLCENLFI